MKATGIVRRIDDLGRVVIPKEIRRTMRIREGDPLEIYTNREGEVIFKKYSPIGELSAFAGEYADTLAKIGSLQVIVTDRDAVIATGGIPKKEYLDLLLDKLNLNLNVFMYDTFLLDKKWMYWNSDDSELIEDIDFNVVNGVKFGVVDELDELNIMLDFIRQNAASLKSEDLHNILYLVRKANDYIFKIYTENTDWELLDSGDSK